MIDLKSAIHLALDATNGAGDADRGARDAATIDHWKSMLPGVPLYKASVDGTLLLFRPAQEDDAKRLMSEPADGRPADAFYQDVVRACLLHPDMSAVADLAQHRPLLMFKLMLQCFSICGFGDDQDFKRADR